MRLRYDGVKENGASADDDRASHQSAEGKYPTMVSPITTMSPATDQSRLVGHS